MKRLLPDQKFNSINQKSKCSGSLRLNWPQCANKCLRCVILNKLSVKGVTYHHNDPGSRAEYNYSACGTVEQLLKNSSFQIYYYLCLFRYLSYSYVRAMSLKNKGGSVRTRQQRDPSANNKSVLPPTPNGKLPTSESVDLL